MDVKNLLLSLAAVLIKPVAKMVAKGAVYLVKKTKEPQDDQFLKALAESILAQVDSEKSE